MIFVVFKPLDVRKQSNSPPLIQLLTKQMMNNTVLQLKKTVHIHFKKYLSPFINQQNLRLINKKGDSMINQLPLYMYIDTNEYTQQIYCTTQSSQLSQQDNAYKYTRNCVIFKSRRNQQLKKIPKQEISRLNHMIKQQLQQIQQGKIIVNGQVMTKQQIKEWSSIIRQNWKQLVAQNQCIYLYVC